MSFRVWSGRIVLATVVPLLLVEGALQAGALAVALLSSRRATPGAVGCALLCVGDSFTYGLGATTPDHSYPGALESLLREHPLDGGWRVVNAGWPSRNSKEVVELLPGQIASFRPRRVAILIGINDLWSHPARTAIRDSGTAPATGVATAGYRLEWRLPRLLALLIRAREVGRTSGVAHGQAKVSKLVRATDAPKRAAAPPPDWNARVWGRISAGDYGQALTLDRAWLAAEPASALAHEHLVRIGKPAARPELVDEGLAWLRARHEGTQDVRVADSLVVALAAANLNTEAATVARADVKRWPDSVRLWSVLAKTAELEHDVATAGRAVERAIALDSSKQAFPLAENLRLRSRLRLARKDLRGAARDALAAYAADHDDAQLQFALRRDGMNCTPALVDELAADAGLSGSDLEKARRIADPREDADPAAAAGVLRDHLHQLVACCRRHGVEPILLTYPFQNEVVTAVQRSAARADDVTLIDLSALFGQLLRHHRREELYVPDGHCNDLGYRFVAEEVARVLHQ